MLRSKLIKKWNSHPEHDYDHSETIAVMDDKGRHPDICWVYAGRNRAKSFDIAADALADAWYDGKEMCYVRRNKATHEEIEAYFSDKVDFIKDMTDGLRDRVVCGSGGRIYFGATTLDENGDVKIEQHEPIGKFMAVSVVSRTKSTQYPKIYNMIYEEVLTDEVYANNEPDKVLNLISTLKRHKQGFRVWLISNLVSVVNPYSKAWGLNLTRQKPGTINLTKLYLGTMDMQGEEEYLLVASHYLEDKGDIKKAALIKGRNRVKTGIASNRWDEAHLYPHVPINFLKGLDIRPEETVIFEYDDLLFKGTLLEVPENLIDLWLDEADKPSDDKLPILYIERKTTAPHKGTRLYTNNTERFGAGITRGFSVIYRIDLTIEQLYKRGWIYGADNLTMNDFVKTFNNLRCMKLGI